MYHSHRDPGNLPPPLKKASAIFWTIFCKFPDCFLQFSGPFLQISGPFSAILHTISANCDFLQFDFQSQNPSTNYKILSTNALFRWPLYKFSDSFLQIQLNPSQKRHCFACFWTVSALITLKNPKNFRALRAQGFYLFLQITTWISQIVMVFYKLHCPFYKCHFFFYKCDFPKMPLYKFHRFLLQF